MFNQNKRKIDSRVRWQSQKFTRKLQNARSYKRPERKLPQTPGQLFLSKLGLDSWLSRAMVAGVFFLLIYLVYIPNFFFIKHISISGADPQTTQTIQDLTTSYLGKQLPWPQKNLLLLSKAGLKNYLLANTQKILSVDKISKKFSNNLSLLVTPRVDTFLLETSDSNIFTVSNDGVVTGQLFPTGSSSLPTLPFLIKLEAPSPDLVVGQPAMSSSTLNFLKKIGTDIPGIALSGIDHYETDSLSSDSLSVFLSSGFKIIFDTTSDEQKIMQKLSLLLSQFSPADLKKLYYVDMRFKDKGYACNKGAPCVQNVALPAEQASSTLSSPTP